MYGILQTIKFKTYSMEKGIILYFFINLIIVIFFRLFNLFRLIECYQTITHNKKESFLPGYSDSTYKYYLPKKKVLLVLYIALLLFGVLICWFILRIIFPKVVVSRQFTKEDFLKPDGKTIFVDGKYVDQYTKMIAETETIIYFFSPNNTKFKKYFNQTAKEAWVF